MKKMRMAPILSALLILSLLLSACSSRLAEPAQPAQESQASDIPAPVEQSPAEVDVPPEAAEEPLEDAAQLGSWVEEPAESTQPAATDPSGEAAEPREGEKVYSIAGSNLSTLSSAASAPDISLAIPTTFQVNRPDKAAISTTLSSYYLMGTSNPGQPVYFQGEEIERLGTKGTWGVHVSLAMGANTFAIRQGDQTTTVTITRTAAGGGTGTINTITSMYPSTQGGAKAGETLLAECVAPSGATVVATFGGRSVTLQQVANANAGVPSTFRGEIPVGTDYPSGVTSKQGKITYRLTYNGQTTEHQSAGEVFIAGSGSYIAVRVTEYQGFVYDDTSNLSVFREKLKTGATDYVYSETDSYFRLYSGGYVPKSQVEIIEGEVKIGNLINGVSTSISGNRERFTFHGISTPAYRAYYGEGDTFVLIVYNTNGAQQVDVSQSRLFSSVRAISNDNSSVSYVFTFKNPGLYWGYNVQYDGNNIVLSLSCKPALASGSQPLSGVTIMLDPGHGGFDSGALGFAGTNGPTENTLNLANAYALQSELNALGAKVVLTRAQLDEYYTLDERLQLFERSDADLFLSLHHNSVAESSDGNNVQGAEIYYHTTHSATTAGKILDSFTDTLGRPKRKSQQSYFRVTLLPTSPSMLLEMGFMCNPVEYEQCSDPAVIQKSAKGIADGIVAALR